MGPKETATPASGKGKALPGSVADAKRRTNDQRRVSVARLAVIVRSTPRTLNRQLAGIEADQQAETERGLDVHQVVYRTGAGKISKRLVDVDAYEAHQNSRADGWTRFQGVLGGDINAMITSMKEAVRVGMAAHARLDRIEHELAALARRVAALEDDKAGQ